MSHPRRFPPHSRVRHVRTGWEGEVQGVMDDREPVLYVVAWEQAKDQEYSACSLDELEPVEPER